MQITILKTTNIDNKYRFFYETELGGAWNSSNDLMYFDQSVNEVLQDIRRNNRAFDINITTSQKYIDSYRDFNNPTQLITFSYNDIQTTQQLQEAYPELFI